MAESVSVADASRHEPEQVRSGDCLVEIHDVSKSYGAVQALSGISLTVGLGEVVVLIGPSGSGKSTLLRCVNHLEDVDRGRILVAGSLVGYAEHRGRLRPLSDKKASAQRAKIGMVFQHFNLFNHKTALENVMEGPVHVMRSGRAQAERQAAELLDRVGLGAKLKAYPGQLSGGQQQRVAIARALAMNPSLLLFDEPTSALDPETVGEVLKVMEDLVRSGMTMMIATHEMGFARQAADRVVMMDQGRVVEVGAPDVIFGNATSQRTRDFLNRIL